MRSKLGGDIYRNLTNRLVIFRRNKKNNSRDHYNHRDNKKLKNSGLWMNFGIKSAGNKKIRESSKEKSIK